jgi:hypothetical protein
MENNNQTAETNNPFENKGYYTTTGKKLKDYFIALAICCLLIFVAFSITDGNGMVVYIIFLNFLFAGGIVMAFVKKRKFIAFAIITTYLIPLLFMGSCFVQIFGGQNL